MKQPGPSTISWATRAALGLRDGLARLDPRLLVLCCALAGLCAWLAPWPWPALLLPAALCPVLAALLILPGGRSIVPAQFFFTLFWSLGFFFFHCREGGEVWSEAGRPALLFGLRLWILLGLTLAAPLALTPLELGRVLAWCLHRLGARESAWRGGLALVIMLAFLPRALRLLADLRRHLRLRAPGLTPPRRFFLLGLAALRLLGAQTWETALAIASRNLYRPRPWSWRPRA